MIAYYIVDNLSRIIPFGAVVRGALVFLSLRGSDCSAGASCQRYGVLVVASTLRKGSTG
jgi:hypothetical protein